MLIQDLFFMAMLFVGHSYAAIIPLPDLHPSNATARDLDHVLMTRRNAKYRGIHHIDCAGIEDSCNLYCASFYCFRGTAYDPPTQAWATKRWPTLIYEDTTTSDQNRVYSGCNAMVCPAGTTCDEWPPAMHSQAKQYTPLRNAIACIPGTQNQRAGARLGTFNVGRDAAKFPHKIDLKEGLKPGDWFQLKFSLQGAQINRMPMCFSSRDCSKVTVGIQNLDGFDNNNNPVFKQLEGNLGSGWGQDSLPDPVAGWED